MRRESEVKVIRPTLVLLMLFGIFVLAQNADSRPSTPAQSRKPAEEHAQWSESLQTSFDISPEKFKKDGLTRLTPSELTDLTLDLFIWHQKELADKVTYHCGPSTPSKKIRVFFEDDEGAPSEVVSIVKQRVRAIPDAEIVFSEEAADMSVSLLVLRAETAADRLIGFTGSISTSTSCQGMWRSTKWPMSLQNNHAIYSNGTASGLADQIVATLDAKDFESQRKSKSYQKPE
jgi:hypothetical protein